MKDPNRDLFGRLPLCYMLSQQSRSPSGGAGGVDYRPLRGDGEGMVAEPVPGSEVDFDVTGHFVAALLTLTYPPMHLLVVMGQTGMVSQFIFTIWVTMCLG